MFCIFVKIYKVGDILELQPYLSVLPQWRKSGIASKLMKAHMDIVTENNLESRLWTTENSWMYFWYLKLGYSKKSEYKEESAVWLSYNSNF